MDEGDREHQLRETVRPEDHDPAGEPRQRTAENAGGEHEERVGDAEMHGRDTGGIGAAAEQRGMAEGRDAAIAGDEIEREYQQRDRGDAGEQRQIVRKEEIADPRQHEDHREARKIAAEPRLPAESAVDASLIVAMVTYLILPARPRGNTQTMAMTAR